MSKLYIVPTPIGNLEDMTFRAIRILKEVDLILAEDTRTSGKLLKHFEIGTHMYSHHMHNEHKTIENLISRLKAGENIALISDAGTPAISDPGFLLTRACVENGVEGRVELVNDRGWRSCSHGNAVPAGEFVAGNASLQHGQAHPVPEIGFLLW